MFRRSPFDRFLRDFFEEASWDPYERCLEPLTEVQDRGHEIVIMLDLPYVKRREDIELRVGEDMVEVKAKMERSIRWSHWGTVQKEIEFTSFRKVIELAEKVDPSGARASFRSGVLKIVLPKARRRVSIRVE
jgi:HSP20 family protein